MSKFRAEMEQERAEMEQERAEMEQERAEAEQEWEWAEAEQELCSVRPWSRRAGGCGARARAFSRAWRHGRNTSLTFVNIWSRFSGAMRRTSAREWLLWGL
jgi:hypothetical protein